MLSLAKNVLTKKLQTIVTHFVEPSIFLAGANTKQEKEGQVETSDQYQDQDGNASGTKIVAQYQGQDWKDDEIHGTGKIGDEVEFESGGD